VESFTGGNYETLDTSGTVDVVVSDVATTTYVTIESSAEAVTEGQRVVFTVSFVDEAGDPVLVPEGETVTLGLQWSGTANASDVVGSLPSSIQVVGGEATATFQVITKVDLLTEGTESLTVGVGEITGAAIFENLIPAPEGFAHGGGAVTVEIDDKLIGRVAVNESSPAVSTTVSFANVYSSDSGVVDYQLSLSGQDVPSGLVDGLTGLAVLLRVVDGEVEGYVSGSPGLVVFSLSASETGDVTLSQTRALQHPDASNPNDAVILGAGLVTLSALDAGGTVGTLDLGSLVTFLDDGPAIWVSNSIASIGTTSFSGTLVADLGLDKFGPTDSLEDLVSGLVVKSVGVGGAGALNFSALTLESAGTDQLTYTGSFSYMASVGSPSVDVEKLATYELVVSREGNGLVYELNLAQSQDLSISSTGYVSTTAVTADVPTFELRYEDAQTGGQPVVVDVSILAGDTAEIQLVSSTGLSTIQTNFYGSSISASTTSIGVDNDVLNSRYTAASNGKYKDPERYDSQMFRFDPEGIANSVSIDFTGNGIRAWRESDVLHVRVNGIRDGVSDTTTLILTGTAGVAGTIHIVPQKGAIAPPPYEISAADLPGGWSGIDSVDVISGFSVDKNGKIRATSAEVSIDFGVTVETVIDASVQFEFQASITDADGDTATDRFVVASTSFDNSAASTPQKIVGSSESDVIAGGSGADVIIGGLGADTLIGGAGADTFLYQSLQDLRSESPGQVEQILDFSSTEGDMVDFGALLDNASNLTNTIHIDNTDGEGSRSVLTIASDGETYELIVDNAHPIPEGESAFYKELDSQTLLGMSDAAGNTSGAWTDVVEVRGAYGGSGPDGWTFKILQPEGGDEVTYELDAEGRRVVFKNSNGDVVSDVHVEITQDGMTHDIQNVDEIKWIV